MINRIVLMGRLVVDPELRTAGNSNLCKFRMAVDRSFVGADGQRQTDFIACQAWGRTADFITKYFRKGQMIALEGQLRQDNYTTPDGQERRSYVVNVDNASFCGSKAETGGGQYQNNNGYSGGYNNNGYSNSGYNGGSYNNNGGYGNNNFNNNAESFTSQPAEDFNQIAAAEDDLPF